MNMSHFRQNFREQWVQMLISWVSEESWLWQPEHLVPATFSIEISFYGLVILSKLWNFSTILVYICLNKNTGLTKSTPQNLHLSSLRISSEICDLQFSQTRTCDTKLSEFPHKTLFWLRVSPSFSNLTLFSIFGKTTLIFDAVLELSWAISVGVKLGMRYSWRIWRRCDADFARENLPLDWLVICVKTCSWPLKLITEMTAPYFLTSEIMEKMSPGSLTEMLELRIRISFLAYSGA